MQNETGRLPCDESWYLAYTEARRELVARDHLERQGYATYLPMYSEAVPMFPRYIFFRPGRLTQSIAPVRSTRGIQTVVRFGSQYARVTPQLISAIRTQESQCAVRTRKLQIGQRVRVQDKVSGLAGLEGLVDSCANRRVVVLMEILGRQTPVRLAEDHLEAV